VIQALPISEMDPNAPPRALIADDRELNFELVRDVLESLGWEAVWARDGREALDLLVAETYDLLLLDLHMPGLSGEEVLRAVRASADRPAPQVVVFTADAMAALNDEMLRLGFDGVLTKPVDLEALTRVAVTISEAKVR
jgi:CheY-like chemotaxis protein